MSMSLKDKKAIKAYIVELLMQQFRYDKKTACDLVDKSPFAQALENDPEYVCHFNLEYWANRIDGWYNDRQRKDSGQYVMV